MRGDRIYCLMRIPESALFLFFTSASEPTRQWPPVDQWQAGKKIQKGKWNALAT